MVPIHLKFQGLWVGVALGELYATAHLNEHKHRSSDLSAPLKLSKTRELCETAARCLNAPAGNLETRILEYERSQDLLLALLPLAFLHQAGIPGLSETLASGLAHSDEPAKFASALTLVQALEWFLNPSRSPQGFIPALLKMPAFQNTATAAQLESIQTAFARHENFQRSPQNLSQETPPETIGPLLYTVLKTPNDFRLTLQSAAFLMPQQPELLMLVGALSGLNTGLRSLPLSWRLRLRTIQWNGVRSLEDGLLNLADICAAQWAGCYTTSTQKWSDLAIAPPGNLCPR